MGVIAGTTTALPPGTSAEFSESIYSATLGVTNYQLDLFGKVRNFPRELKAEIVRLINRIEAHGCVVKDIDLGLLDFPSMREGRPVYLCWKAGEIELTHWHGTDESFADRKLL